MRIQPYFCLFALGIFFSTLQLAAAQRTQKIIDFRDGTILRIEYDDIELPWRRISDVGEITEAPIRLSEIAQLRFVLTPITEQLADVRKLIVQLGAERYQNRRTAQYELVARAGRFLPVLEQSALKTMDYEAKWRLLEVIAHLKDSDRILSNDYDRLLLKGDNAVEVNGDVGRWAIRPKYRGVEVLLDRMSVLAIRDAPPDFKPTAEPEVVHMERIVQDDDSHFPKDVTRVDFDRTPGGQPLQSGTDLTNIYVPVGCIFESSYPDSFIGVEPYNVGGRSGGHCAATHEPLYQGTITVRFCKPGNARVPAGVRYVGFWTSHVAIDGTILQAFDARDRKIAEIRTLRAQRDFLAFSTNVPMAYIKIVPDEDIDPDFAIDDLVFDTPRPLSEAGDPDRFSAVLTTGERLYCTGVEKSGNTVTFKNLTVGISQIKIPASEVLVFVPPRTPLPEEVTAKWCFVRMADGSVMRASGGEGIKLARFPQLAITPEKLVALWGATTKLVEPPEWPANDYVLLDKDKAYRFKNWKLGEKWIESTDIGFEAEGVTYQNSPTIWLQKPTKRPKSTGLLRTSWGEEIVLTSGEGFHLKTWSEKGVTIVRGENEWTVPLSDVSSLLLPQPEAE